MLWFDKTNELKDLPGGYRQYRCRDVSVFQHLASERTAIVFFKKEKMVVVCRIGIAYGSTRDRLAAEERAFAIVKQSELVLGMK